MLNSSVWDALHVFPKESLHESFEDKNTIWYFKSMSLNKKHGLAQKVKIVLFSISIFLTCVQKL